MHYNHYFNRDLSWLSFNERVMEEAANEAVPLLERLKFLSIFSSNLDEFYRVRMPVLRALKKIGEKEGTAIDADEQSNLLNRAADTINAQQNRFGKILREQLLPRFKNAGIHILYNEPFPDAVKKEATEYFFAEVLAFLQPVDLHGEQYFFPGNNKLYFVVNMLDNDGKEQVMLLNIPSDELPRFFTIKTGELTYVAFLDDIVRCNLDKVFATSTIQGCYSIKVTRDAELDLKDEYSGDVSDEIRNS